MCSCGRSFSTEITIRETTNVETSSPPATPMLVSKPDIKHHQYIQTSASKRAKTSATDSTTSSSSLIPTTTLNELVDRLHPSSNIVNWHTTTLKHYEHSPGSLRLAVVRCRCFSLSLSLSDLFTELLTTESTREESEIELSSDDSRCLDEIDVVLSRDKTTVSNFIYSNSLWPTSLSPSTPMCLSYSTDHQENIQSQNSDDHHQHHHHHHHHHQEQLQQRQLITLKPVGHEPLSPVPALLHDEQLNKDLGSIHRQPMLIPFIHPDVRSPTGPTHFKCAQCHETFDSLLLGQEHVNNGMCILEVTVNVRERLFEGMSKVETSSRADNHMCCTDNTCCSLSFRSLIIRIRNHRPPDHRCSTRCKRIW